MTLEAAEAHRLSAAARHRGLLVLLVSTFFAWGGFFMVIPMISVHYVDGLGWTAAAVGLVLAARLFFQQGLTPLSGILADRVGAKPLIALGMLVRAFGFGAMAFATTYGLLMVAAIVSAIGGALFESPRTAAVAALTDEADRSSYFAKTGVVAGLGITVGTQLGALLLALDFRLVALVSAASYVVILLMILVWLPPVRVAEPGGAFRGLRLVVHDRQFLSYTGLIATAVAGNPNAVAWVYAVNSAIAVLLGYPLPRLVERKIGARHALICGVMMTAVGLLCIGFSRDAPTLLLATAVYSLGIVLTRPTEQVVASSLASPRALGSYFGIASLSIAFCGGLGNFAGGLLYDWGQRMQIAPLPWITFACVGTASALGLWWTLRKPSVRQDLRPDMGVGILSGTTRARE